MRTKRYRTTRTRSLYSFPMKMCGKTLTSVGRRSYRRQTGNVIACLGIIPWILAMLVAMTPWTMAQITETPETSESTSAATDADTSTEPVAESAIVEPVAELVEPTPSEELEPIVTKTVEESTDETPVIQRDAIIYIPYEKLKQTFEKDGRGVFLPHEQFQALWNAAQANREPTPVDVTAPVDWIIRDTVNTAVVETDVVRVTSKIRFEVLKRGWFEIPLRLDNSAILNATLDGEVAKLVPDNENGGAKLLVENSAEKEPRAAELTLVFAGKIERSPGRNAVTFRMPQTPVSRWTVMVPESGVDVNFTPMIATTMVESQSSEDTENAGNMENNPESSAYGTVVRAFVGTAPEVRIEWTARTEGATGLTALAGVQTDQNVTIGESVSRNRVTMVWTISRAEIPTLSVKIPADQKIIQVFDPNVKQWSVEPITTEPATSMESTVESGETPTETSAETEGNPEETAAPETPVTQNVSATETSTEVLSVNGPTPAFQKLNVTLFEPAKTTQTLVIETEKFSEDQTLDESVEVAIPVFEALDVARQQGLVSVQVEPGIRAEIVRSGTLLRVDTNPGTITENIAQTNTAQPEPTIGNTTPAWSGAWRYATGTFELVLKLEKILPRVSVDLLTEVEVQPDQRLLRTTAVYRIEDAGTFDLTLNIPVDYDIQYLHGRGFNDVQNAAVSQWRLESADGTPEGPKTKLVIRLAKRTIGKVGVLIGMTPKKVNGAEVNVVPVETTQKTGTTQDESIAQDTSTEGDESIAQDTDVTEAVGTTKDMGESTEQRWRFAIPSVADPEISEVTGTIVVLAPERLQVYVRETTGAQNVSPAEVYGNPTEPVEPQTRTARSWILPTTEISGNSADPKRLVPIAAYLTGRGEAQLNLNVTPRRPQVNIRQFLKVLVDEGQVQYNAFFFYDIRYSGISQLRFEVPESITSTLQNHTAGVYETAPEAGKTATSGYVVKAYRGDSELLGTGTIQLSWKENFASPEPGQTRRILIPKLVPMEVTSAWGQIGIAKAEAIDVSIAGDPETRESTELAESDTQTGNATQTPVLSGVQPIDPRYDLMEGIAAEGFARAFSYFSNDWNLTLDVTRYALESPADTSVEKTLVRMVVTRADRVSVQAVWRFRTARQRLTLWLPNDATLESQPSLDGKPIVLERSDAADGVGNLGNPETLESEQGTNTTESTELAGNSEDSGIGGKGEWFHVPVLRPDPERVVLLQVRYTVPVETGTRLRDGDRTPWIPGTAVVLPIPRLGRETPIQMAMVEAWIPGEYRPVDHGGAWTFVRGSHWLGIEPSDPWTVNELLDGIETDVAAQRAAEIADFSTDGVHIEFVSVGAMGDEPLEIRYIKKTYLEAAIFFVTLIVGVLVWFIPRSVRGRLVAMAIAGIAAAAVVLFDTDVGIVTIQTVMGFAIAMVVNVGIWFLCGCWTIWRGLRRRMERVTEEGSNHG